MELMLRLVAALVSIRVTVFLLRLSLGPQTWLSGWENRITLMIWFVVAINMLGWLDPVIGWLEQHSAGARPTSAHRLVDAQSLFIVSLFVLAGAGWRAGWNGG